MATIHTYIDIYMRPFRQQTHLPNLLHEADIAQNRRLCNALYVSILRLGLNTTQGTIAVDVISHSSKRVRTLL